MNTARLIMVGPKTFKERDGKVQNIFGTWLKCSNCGIIKHKSKISKYCEYCGAKFIGSVYEHKNSEPDLYR